MEANLLRIWARGCPEDKTVAEVFGPYENWSLRLGTRLLLLHPVLKEWLYFDELHGTWERTGFGPGEVVFVASGDRLGFRRKKRAISYDRQLPIQGGPKSSPIGVQATTLCPACGAQVKPGQKFCTQCGAALRVSGLCPACGAQVKPGQKFCTQCGAPLG